MKTGYVFSVNRPPEKKIAVTKPGKVSAYILGDLKPCIEADLLYDGRSIHIDRVLFDTGADMTVVNPSVMPDHGMDEGVQIHGADSFGSAETYYCSLSLGSGSIVLNNIQVHALDLDVFDSINISLILGMDVITLGVLTVCKSDPLPIFTFEIK